MDSLDVHKAEFDALTAESRMHNTTASTIVSVAIAALGVGFPIAINEANAFPGLAILLSVLWLRYLDHVTGMYRIAAYVSIRLAPRVQELLNDSKLLEWERFLRELRAGLVTSQRGNRVYSIPAEGHSEKTLGLGYTSLLFGATPPLMIGAYVYLVDWHVMPESLVSAAACVLVACAWTFTLVRWLDVTRWISTINTAISV